MVAVSKGDPLIRYRRLVEASRALVLRYKHVRFEIVKLTLEACNIQHGGDRNRKRTIKEFSKEIGLNYAVLTRWVGEYRRTYLRLTEEQQKEADDNYTALHRTHGATTGTTPIGKVRDLFEKNSNYDDRNRTLQGYLRQFNSCLSLIRKHKISELEPEIVEELRRIARKLQLELEEL